MCLYILNDIKIICQQLKDILFSFTKESTLFVSKKTMNFK